MLRQLEARGKAEGGRRSRYECTKIASRGLRLAPLARASRASSGSLPPPPPPPALSEPRRAERRPGTSQPATVASRVAHHSAQWSLSSQCSLRSPPRPASGSIRLTSHTSLQTAALLATTTAYCTLALSPVTSLSQRLAWD